MTIFNVPYLTGKEIDYIQDTIVRGKISGDGYYTRKCNDFFEKEYGFKKALLTTSCTDALELAAILIDIKLGDEVIMPSYTFVSTSNAFVLRGAKIVFADSRNDHPGMDEQSIKQLITEKTKAIVVVHYAGVACDMDIICNIAAKHNLFIIEDAAQAIDSYYKGKRLGTIGHLSAFSFHETKNIQCGEGGLLVINDDKFSKRAEIIREKGTNRSAFFRGEIDKYGWIDVGSSFLPSDILAAFLFAQLENIDDIQKKRKHIWNLYHQGLVSLTNDHLMLPSIPEFATNNAHMFYLVCKNLAERTGLIDFLKQHNVQAVFHYQSLHKSPFIVNNNGIQPSLPQCEIYTDCLLRLPMYYTLNDKTINHITQTIKCFYELPHNG